MAGEIYIARQDTLEAVQDTVEGIDTNVNTANSALGNFAGGAEDTVKTELEALKSSMAQLQTKSEQLESKIDQLINSGGDKNSFFDFDNATLYGPGRNTENLTVKITANKIYKIIAFPCDGFSNEPTNGFIYIEAGSKRDIKLNGKLFVSNFSGDYELPLGIPFTLESSSYNTITLDRCFCYVEND